MPLGLLGLVLRQRLILALGATGSASVLLDCAAKTQHWRSGTPNLSCDKALVSAGVPSHVLLMPP